MPIKLTIYYGYIIITFARMIYQRNRLRFYATVLFFALAVLVAIAIAVLFLRGVRFDLDQGIVETGVIRINSVPEDVNVFVNGEKYERNGKLVQSVPLGRTTLTLQKEGFTTWEKVVQLDNKEVKDIYAQLFPIELQLTQEIKLPIDSVIYSPDETMAFFVVLDNELPANSGLWKYRLSSTVLNLGSKPEPEKFASLPKELSNQLLLPDFTVKVALDNSTLMFLIPSSKSVLVYNTNGLNDVTDFSAQLGYWPENIDWYKDNETVLINHNGVLFTYNIKNRKQNLLSVGGVLPGSYCLSKDTVYFIDPATKTLASYKDETVKIVSASLYSNQDFVSLQKVSCSADTPEVLLLKTALGIIFIDNAMPFSTIVTTTGEVIDFANNGQSILYKDAERFFSFILKDKSNRTYDSYQKEVKVENVEDLYYSNLSTHIISIQKLTSSNTNVHSLVVMDKEGENSQKILTDRLFIGDSVIIVENGQKMFVGINNGSEESNSAEYSFYSIDLRK